MEGESDGTFDGQSDGELDGESKGSFDDVLKFKSRINASRRIADIAYARGLLARLEQATSEVVLVTPNIF